MMDLLSLLPQPILPAHPEWVELYWKAWELAEQNIRHGTPHNNFAESYVDDSFSDNIFQWDTCFIVRFARYGSHCLPVLPALDNFYRKQEPDGYICREYRGCNGAALWSKGSADAVNPPLFAWAEWGYYQLSGDLDRLREVWPRLIAHHRWLAPRQRNENGLYWSTTWGCGMDNVPRYAASWVDFSAQQAMNALYLARIAEAVGEDEAAAEFRSEHAALAGRINELMWDEEAGYYWDLDTVDEPFPAKTIAPFWTLLAEVVPPDRADRLADHLSNPSEFWRPHVFPTISADHPLYSPEGNYWRGSVWPLTNYAVIKGLSRCGHTSLARQAAENHLGQMSAVYRETGTIWENYSPEYLKPGNISKGDFVGFSGVGPIALLIEEVLGIEVDAPSNIIQWRLHRTTEQGLSNLRFGDNTVSLLAKETNGEEIAIQVTTQREFTLKVQRLGAKTTFSVPPGIHCYVL